MFKPPQRTFNNLFHTLLASVMVHRVNVRVLSIIKHALELLAGPGKSHPGGRLVAAWSFVKVETLYHCTNILSIRQRPVAIMSHVPISQCEAPQMTKQHLKAVGGIESQYTSLFFCRPQFGISRRLTGAEFLARRRPEDGKMKRLN